ISTPMANYGFKSTAYDPADRLTAWNRTDGNLDQSWNLSLVGNWATFTENQVQQTRSHTAVHEIAAIDAAAITHDPTGNLTRNAGDAFDRYTWDFDNRLASADVDQDGTAEIAYQYDARGRRVSKTVPDGEGSVTTVFVYLGNQVVSEYAADALPASPERKFVYATYIDEPVVMIDRTAMGTVAAGTDELLFYHCNSLYSVAAVTDAAGTVVERYAYSAYGKPLFLDANASPLDPQATTVGNPYLFTGRRLDPETGLYYYRARMYDAELGRFMGRDPIGYEGVIQTFTHMSIARRSCSGILRECQSIGRC
ncbi:MAG: RHS repeat-associated core domain-containing protein, partial [Patescibacteria group bacterium]|nr:RHS repeat-associated core domain-containing protein [Patescibacteria group bacterium]